jgi:hypothetical protein
VKFERIAAQASNINGFLHETPRAGSLDL